MVGGSVIRQATRNATRTIVFAAAAVAAVIALALLERLHYGGLRDAAADRAVEAADAAKDLSRLDAMMASTAALLAHTGDLSQRDTLAAMQTRFDTLMRTVSPHTPMSVMERLAPANVTLAQRYSDVSLLALNGRLMEARGVLAAPAYVRAAAVRSAAFAELYGVIDADRQRALRLIDQVAATVLLAALALIALAATMIAVRMRRRLKASETAFLEADERIRDLAAVDPLTGALSRGAFREEVRGLCDHAARSGAAVSVIVLDIDDFTTVVDRLGFLAADALLRQAASRLRAQLRPGESLGRIAHDTFAVSISLRTEDHKAVLRAHDLHRALCGGYAIDADRVTLCATVGVASANGQAREADGLLSAAGVAVRHGKVHARGAVSVYHAATMEALDERAQLGADLRDAIARDEIEPVFLPIVDLASGAVSGVEALARWRHPTLGPVSPSVFVPLADQLGLIDALMESVLRKACAQAVAFGPSVSVVINAAPSQVVSGQFAERVLKIITQAGWPASRLTVDITESALMADFAAARRTVLSLRNLGVKVALDDFGTGYASLAYLGEMAFDALKIDRAFVRTLHDSDASARVVAAIAGLGASLNLSIVAEGVESVRDADALAALGCDAAQGFHFGKPMAAAAVAAFVAERSAAGAAVPPSERVAA